MKHPSAHLLLPLLALLTTLTLSLSHRHHLHIWRNCFYSITAITKIVICTVNESNPLESLHRQEQQKQPGGDISWPLKKKKQPETISWGLSEAFLMCFDQNTTETQYKGFPFICVCTSLFIAASFSLSPVPSLKPLPHKMLLVLRSVLQHWTTLFRCATNAAWLAVWYFLTSANLHGSTKCTSSYLNGVSSMTWDRLQTLDLTILSTGNFIICAL